MTVVTVATVTAVIVTAREAAGRDATRQLLTAADTARDTLRYRGDQLTAAVDVLTSDFGFKEAVSSGDRPTLLSAMTNQRARIAADLLVILGPEGEPVASTLSSLSAGALADLHGLVADDSDGQVLRLYRLLDGRPYQLVIAPVLAPMPIAWAVMGFALNDKVAADMGSLLGVSVSFVVTDGEGQGYVASSLSSSNRASLAPAFALRAPVAPVMTRSEGEDYLTWVRPIRSANGGLNLVLQRSLTAALQPFVQLRNAIIAIGVLVLGIAFLAAAWLSRGALRPVIQLTRAAERLEAGDYSVPVAEASTVEFGQLAAAFESMRGAIADREQTIRHQSLHDRLTGLPTRGRLLELLATRLAAAAEDARSATLWLVELQHLRDVVGSFGHEAADDVVRDMAHRLTQACGPEDCVARIGTDQFAVLRLGIESGEALALAETLSATLRAPFDLGDLSLHLETRIGVALFPEDATFGESLLQRADLALYRARESGKSVGRFMQGDDDAQRYRLSVLGDLRRAIDANELELHYQPKVSLADGTVRGCESLVRWRHPQRGFIPPGEFIGFAEQAGLVTAITDWVLREAFRQAEAWRVAGFGIKVSVNVSTVDLADDGFVDRVRDLLRETGVDPTRILFEVTEGAALKDLDHTLRVMAALRALGIRFSVDDFGTGYSSLAHLKRLPVSELKIDRSFVMDLGDRPGDAVILKSTIDLGHALGLEVVAEGVEDEAGMQALARLGCDIVQGYVIARPMPGPAFRAWLLDRGA